MPTCSKCGATADQGITQCPKCGAAIEVSSASSYRRSGTAASVVQYPPQRTTQSKPTGVRALSVLFVLGGINSLYMALLSNPLSPYLASVPSVYPFGFLIQNSMYFFGALGILSLVAGLGLVRLGKWAWKLGIVVCALAILSIVTSNYVGAILGVVSAYFMIKNETRVWFRRV